VVLVAAMVMVVILAMQQVEPASQSATHLIQS